MSLCVCGNPSDTFGGMCDRCASVQMLDLKWNATDEEIESAYFTLVKVWHPDRFASDPKLHLAAEEKLKEINAAHDYLVAHPRQEGPSPRSAPRPQRPPAPEASDTPEPPEPPIEEPITGKETREVRRILRRQRKPVAAGILLRLAFALGGIALVAVVMLTADSILENNSKTAGPWERMKAELEHDIRSNGSRLFPSTPKTPPAQEPAAQPQEPEAPPSQAAGKDTGKAKESGKDPGKHIEGAQPYITAGLTPMEVLAVLGKPTSSTGEKMFYKGSEIDFRNGQVAGWKIDPASGTVRVKLWPDKPLGRGVTGYGLGSSKSDVIALQGTPTFFSDNEFGYGNSRVFFANNRVSGWKQDPASVRLRVAR